MSRIQGYIDDVVPYYNDVDFRRMFRVTFITLANYLKDCPEIQPADPGRREPISVDKQIF